MEKIGKYEIVKKIAEGNFATLYEAKEPSPPAGLGRRVALKLCSADDELLRQRFGREVELIAQLGHHPNIAAAYDIGYLEGAPYLVEEYLPGEDLRQKIERKDDLPAETKVGWLLQVAKGLKFAHSKEIVHRDIKPENVRISPSGHVKIIDFGIGKAVSSEATRLTMDGTIMGTLGYLAPEQLRGKADLRSDIFSFGVMAYEFLTYTHPFTATSLREQFRVLMEDEPEPMSRLWPDCPPGLEKVVKDCLEKDLDRRAQSFDAIVEALRTELRSLEMAPKPAAPAPSSAQATFILDKEALQALTEEESRKEKKAPPVQAAAVPAPPPPTEAVAEKPEAAPVEVESTKKGEKKEAAPVVAPAETAVEKKDKAKEKKTPEPKKAEAKKPAEAVPPPPPPAVTAPEKTPEKAARKQKQKEPTKERARQAEPTAVKPEPAKPSEEKAAARTGVKPRFAIPKWAYFAAGGLVVVALLAVWLTSGSGPSEETPQPRARAVEPTPAEEATAATGTLHVQAYPWGEVRFEDASQVAVTLDEEVCHTPCTVELDPGTYTAYVVNPAYPGTELTCEASVVAGTTGTCHVVFGKAKATDYFKAAGWWQ